MVAMEILAMKKPRQIEVFLVAPTGFESDAKGVPAVGQGRGSL